MGRRYTSDEWLEFMLLGELGSQAQAVRYGEHEIPAECYDDIAEIDSDDVIVTAELNKAKEGFERDVRKAIKAWAKKHPLRGPLDVDDIMEDGAAGDVYLALDGSGAGGLVDGDWNDVYFSDGDQWNSEELVEFMTKRLGHYVDWSGAGKIPEAMGDAVYRTFQASCYPEANPMGRDARAALGAGIGGAVGGGYGAHRGGRSGGALGGAAGGAVGSFVAAHLAEITGAFKGFGEGAKQARRRELASPRGRDEDRQRRAANRVTIKTKKKRNRR